MYNCEILADSLNPQGDRLITMKVTFPRIVLAEFNTHRMFCLSGDSTLTFDLPSGTAKSSFKPYRLTLKEYYDKWVSGAPPLNRKQMNITQDDLTTFSEVFLTLSRNGVIEPLPQSDKLLELLALTYPDSKLKVVKAYKFLCDIGLKEAKEAADNYFMNNQKSLELDKIKAEIEVLMARAKELDPGYPF